jgi:hypothetical protein
VRLGNMGGAGAAGVAHVPLFSRYAAWFMLAGQEFVNKVVRLAIPYLVPFIAQEGSFTPAATARLLTGFSLGYVTCQVPAGYISTVLGPKFVQLCNNIGLTVLFLGLPSLARRGSMAVFGAVLGVGVLQGPFMIAHHGMSYNWSPAEDSPERPWARFIMHLGNHCKLVHVPPAAMGWASLLFAAPSLISWCAAGALSEQGGWSYIDAAAGGAVRVEVRSASVRLQLCWVRRSLATVHFFAPAAAAGSSSRAGSNGSRAGAGAGTAARASARARARAEDWVLRLDD